MAPCHTQSKSQGTHPILQSPTWSDPHHRCTTILLFHFPHSTHLTTFSLTFLQATSMLPVWSLHLLFPVPRTLFPQISHGWLSHLLYLSVMLSANSSLDMLSKIATPPCHFFSLIPSLLLSSGFSTHIFHILFAHLFSARV